ncbi:MAG TPA: DUF1877 family protein, partial [Puia sp.]|nr:DUF1877 family protein [Puia sp.]
AEEGEFPLNFIVSGGESIGDDIGYGPLRILFPKDVEALKFELDKITVKDFEARFDAEELKLNDIYPLTDHWVDEDKQWLTEVYDGLKSYVDKACSNKNSLFVAIV